MTIETHPTKGYTLPLISALDFVKIIPASNGWSAEWHRHGIETRMFYGISPASVKRIERIILTDGYCNYHVELGRTGWAEFELYPDQDLIPPGGAS